MEPFDDGRDRGSGAVGEDQRQARSVRSILTQRDQGLAEHAHLIVNPTNDAVFEEHARRLAALSDRPAVLQTSLRQQYPEAVVRRRELSGEPFEMWYVYRDGHWSPADR